MIRQPNSRYCFACGRSNPIGLYMKFDYDGERVWSRFRPREEHQGYPGLLHGGLAATMLDEVLGRLCIARNRWMATVKLELRYHAPVPIDQELTLVAEVLEERRRLMRARGELRLEDGTVAVSAVGTYLPLPDEVLERWEEEMRYWKVDPD